MSPSEAACIAQFLCADFAYEMQTTLRVLAAAPDAHLSYRPDNLSKTGIGLLRHLALEDEWLLNSIANHSFTPPPDDSDACAIHTAADAVARYQEKVPAALERVRQLPPEKLTAVLDMFGAIQMPAVNFLSLAMKHSVHHRGQLSSYLRAMGGKVPGIYGPTAETQASAASGH